VKLFWMIVAGFCILVAAVFLLRRELNVAFVTAAIGLIAWFLNYRIQMKEIVATADVERENLQREDLDEH
jgi:hypothetical protein